jgi:hypothetical protein
MLVAPGGSFDVVTFAEPDESVTVARRVVPFRYSTRPVGVPANDETVAVKVTDLPCNEGFKDDKSTVVVVALVTSCDNGVDVLAVKLESPL